MLINCTCKSTAQDSLHGKQRRVANKTTKVGRKAKHKKTHTHLENY